MFFLESGLTHDNSKPVDGRFPAELFWGPCSEETSIITNIMGLDALHEP